MTFPLLRKRGFVSRVRRFVAADRRVRVDPREVSVENDFYGRLGEAWWDPSGPLSALHDMTPVRADYFDGVFARVLGREGIRSGRFADIGCGGGIVTEEMARRGYPMAGVDLSAGALMAARRHAAATGLKIRYERGSAYELPIRSGGLSGVIASDIFEHLSDLPGAVSEISRVLAPGGVLVFDTVNRTWLSLVGAIGVVQNLFHLLPAHTHEWRLFITPRELRSVLERVGLTVQELCGLAPAAHPVKLFFRLWRSRTVGPYTLSRDMRISYIGYAVKR